MKTHLTIILFAVSFSISAQSKLDSLYAVWQDQSQEDSTRVSAYHKYIWDGFLFSKPDSAFRLAERLYEFANQQNYLSANAQGLYVQGISLHQRGNYSEALVYYKNGSDQFEEIGDQEGIASCLNATGLIYLYKNDYSKALNYFTRSLKIRDEIDDRQGVASVLNNIGYIYHNQGDYPFALDYYSKSLEIREDIGDQQGIATSLINIGETYTAQDNYLKALDYYSRSLKLFEEIGNQQGVASALNNFGYAYRNQGDYPNALNYYLQSLKIREYMGDQHGIATSLNNIGNIYKIMGNYRRAIAYCENGLELANRIGLLLEQKEGCTCLYDVYKSIGNGNKALDYHELLTVIEDSLNAEGTSKKLQQMEFQKQITVDSLAQIEKDRLVQKANDDEVRKKNKTINIAIGGGLLFMILAGGFFSRWRYIKKSRDIISKEKDRSENLLLNILPPEIAEELKTKGRADARDFNKVSILFTDFKSFTEASAKLSAQDLVSEINVCFEVFDGIMGKYGIEKIKTIGDAYMAAGGLPVPSDDSVKNTVLAALEMQAFISKRKAEMEILGKHSFEMRAGIHTGPVVAGIVGVKKFQYDIWGDAVNTASRMESNGQIGKVNISKYTYELIRDNSQFTFKSRGKIQAKGKGEIEMYLVERTAS
jgi:class 3 adenylate cyclase/TPR repeat protein